MKINIPDYVSRLMNILYESGFQAYIVGGCVRDMLMGRNPQDYDITTNALPEDIKKCFKDYRTILIGEKHGTVAVVSDSKTVEITTYRIDGKYHDQRHPENVEFTSDIKDDLSRRDFTMNAIAYSDKDGIIDVFGGVQDIRDGIISCVGNPAKRFEEDALRIMRALRFSAVLGFEIDDEAERIIHQYKADINNISKERVFSELCKMLSGGNVKNVLCKFADIITVVIPELKESVGFDQRNIHHCYDVYTHSAYVVQSCPDDTALKLAALLHDSGKPACFFMGEDGQGHFYGHAAVSAQIADAVLTRLKSPTALKKLVCELITIHDREIVNTDKSIKRFLKSVSFESAKRIFSLKKADNLSLAPEYHSRITALDETCARMEKIISDNECVREEQLAINGNDLIRLGISPGKHIGIIKNHLLDLVIDGKVKNTKEELEPLVKSIISQLTAD